MFSLDNFLRIQGAQTPAGSDAQHQKCNNHFASLITVAGTAGARVSNRQLYLPMSAKYSSTARTGSQSVEAPDQSTKDHQIKAHNASANPEQLQDLGCHIYARILPFCDHHLERLGPLGGEACPNSQPFNHHQHSSVSRQRSTFSARLLRIKIKPLSSTEAFIVPFVE